ncbi:cell division protein ZapA [Neptuniibacter halophilus]|uniref:cell division protein ZapA n=1 Tax=Neptuniibacter halophilus TaxID=651666 RepID=UPI00257391E7|nr:cell division protein ZapA [Neptuniibacter halophilus]
MSTQDSQPVSIKLLDKEFNFNCPADAEAELLASADFLNEKMIEIRKNGKVLGLERIAIMAALNLAHELLQSKQVLNSDVEARLRHLGSKIDLALQQSSADSELTEND